MDRGTAYANHHGVAGVARFEDLVAWQRMYALSLEIWKATETQSLLKKGLDIGYWSPDEFDRLNSLAVRGLQSVAALQRYLRSQRARANAARRSPEP